MLTDPETVSLAEEDALRGAEGVSDDEGVTVRLRSADPVRVRRDGVRDTSVAVDVSVRDGEAESSGEAEFVGSAGESVPVRDKDSVPLDVGETVNERSCVAAEAVAESVRDAVRLTDAELSALPVSCDRERESVGDPVTDVESSALPDSCDRERELVEEIVSDALRSCDGETVTLSVRLTVALAEREAVRRVRVRVPTVSTTSVITKKPSTAIMATTRAATRMEYV